MVDYLIHKFCFSKHEKRLARCQNYSDNNILKWKQQTNLTWLQVNKFLNNLEVFDSQKIKIILKDILKTHSSLFSKKNLYITSFGSEGKSGGKIAYELRHSGLISEDKFIESWNLSDLPPKSIIIFLEDLIGTGSQSTEYIIEKLNLILNPSFEAYLLTICATPIGIEKVEKKTRFKVLNGILLTEDKYQNFSDQCNNFSIKEKEIMRLLNNKLTSTHKPSYDLGLLVTFFYSPPNNAMPILWKDGYKYDENKKWTALIPRKFTVS